MPTLIFDCDGVLADTERYGHLPSFNQTFEEFGLPFRWSEEEYGRKLAIGGGKERMTSELTPDVVRAAGLPEDPEAVVHEASIRLYGLDELRGMVAEAGFEEIAVYGSYQGERYDGWQRQLLYIGRKRA